MSSIGVRLLTAVKKEGVASVARRVYRRVWSTTTREFILRCDLERLVTEPPAKTSIAMQPVDLLTFTGFVDELERVAAPDVAAVRNREQMRLEGIEGLYTCFSSTGQPMFSQWLMRPDQPRYLSRVLRSSLRDDEVLIEGAYTFVEFRRLGAMGAGMHQLLARARDDGFRWAFTGVRPGNIPSLRGCYRVGFQLDYVRKGTHRLGRYRRIYLPPGPEDWSAWRRAVGLDDF